jgi:hypothetical protein
VSQGALLKLAFLQMRADHAEEERHMEDKLDEQNQVNHIVIQFALRASVPSSGHVDFNSTQMIEGVASGWESHSPCRRCSDIDVCCVAFEWMLKTERMMRDAMEVTAAKQSARRSELHRSRQDSEE